MEKNVKNPFNPDSPDEKDLNSNADLGIVCELVDKKFQSGL
jgi:hypothetical protein